VTLTEQAIRKARRLQTARRRRRSRCEAYQIDPQIITEARVLRHVDTNLRAVVALLAHRPPCHAGVLTQTGATVCRFSGSMPETCDGAAHPSP
jgi:hypothetical protein